MTHIDQTLTAREKTHGEYHDHARVTQGIKDVIRSGPSYDRLLPHERETLDMLAHKIGRIVSGDPHFHDHWFDIQGYAKLSADRNMPPPTVTHEPDSLIGKLKEAEQAADAVSYSALKEALSLKDKYPTA